MIEELKTYQFTCDKCKTTEIKVGEGFPEGWKQWTGYLKHLGWTSFEACPNCIKKLEKSEKLKHLIDKTKVF